MSRAISDLVRSVPAVRTTKPTPLGGLRSSMMSRSTRRSRSSSIFLEMPTRPSGGIKTRYRPGIEM